MKPELRIALVKEVERSKRVLSEERYRRWNWLRYAGAAGVTLYGVAMFTRAIGSIADHHGTRLEEFVGFLVLLAALLLMLVPSFLLVRYYINRKIRLLSEAILSTGQFDGFIAG